MPCLQRRGEGGPIYKGLLPGSIQAWDNDCWSNNVIEELLDQRQITPQSLNSTAWVVGLVQQAWSIHRKIPPSALEQSSKTNTAQNLESNTATWVAYRAHG